MRTMLIEGEPWFVAKDVCRCLDIGNDRKALMRLDADEKGVTISDTLGGAQTMNIVSEPGVFRLVFTSRSEAAERFKRWLAHDVLPQIRKTGRYSVSEALSPRMEEIELINAHTRNVAEARRIYGRAAARQLWEKSPLPQISKAEPHFPRGAEIDPEDDGMECLTHLLRHAAGNGGSIAGVIDLAFADDIARGRVEAMGLKVIAGATPRVAIAEKHEALAAIYAGSPWSEDWYLPLLSLDGALSRQTRFGLKERRAVHLPKAILARVRRPN